MSVICKPENIHRCVIIVDCLETLQNVTNEEIDNHEKTYGDLGEKYLSMIQRSGDPHGFASAYKLLIDSRVITHKDLNDCLDLVRTYRPAESVSIDKLTFVNKDYAVSFLTTLLEHVEKVTERLQKYEMQINEYMKSRFGGV